MPPSPITIPINSASSTSLLGFLIGRGRRRGFAVNLPSDCPHARQPRSRRTSSIGNRPYFACTARAPFNPAFRVCAYLSRRETVIGIGTLARLERSRAQSFCIANFSRRQSQIVRGEHLHMRAISRKGSFSPTFLRNFCCSPRRKTFRNSSLDDSVMSLIL